MSKALSSFPKNKREEVARRRAAQSVKGLGHWAAKDYLAKKKAEKDNQSK